MLNRRSVLSGLAAAMLAPAMAFAGDHPSIIYMRQVAKDLLAAHRQGTTAAFQRVIMRHADLPTISQYSLGQFAGNLQSSQRARYQRAVAIYIARVFSLGSRDYTVSKYDIGDASVDKDKNVVVTSKVYLVTGQQYAVKWHLVWRGGRYKVSDVSMTVLGFTGSLTSQQRSEFVSFLKKYNGNINMLISALQG